MTVLVTGGAGFIGSNLCDRLLSKDKSVICVDNFNNYYDPNRKRKNITHAQEKPLFKLYEVDIRDSKELEKVFSENRINSVVHLAARAGVRPSIKDPFLYEEVNIKGTLNMLELSKKYDIDKFVFGSSSSVYGNTDKVPFSEDQHTDRPVSPYGATKKAGEAFCYSYHHLYGMDIACLRFFTVYGPRGRPDMAPYLFTDWVYTGQPIKMFGNGTSKRDYTYIDDIIAGITKTLDKKLGYEVINLGNSNTIMLKDFISMIEEATGKEAVISQFPEQPGDVKTTHANIAKAKKLLGWQPKTNINKGIENFVDWYAREVAGGD